jgi:hypothetical protein
MGTDQVNASPASLQMSPIATPNQNYHDNVLGFELQKIDGTAGIPNLAKGDQVNAEVGILTNFPDQQEVQVLVDLGYLKPVTDTNLVKIDENWECNFSTRLAMHFVLCRGSLAAFGSPHFDLPTLQLAEDVITGTYQVRASLIAGPDEVNKDNNAVVGHFTVGGANAQGEQIFLPLIAVNN